MMRLRGVNQASQYLKEALLSDWNISCTVLSSSRVPRPEAMRMAFLGEVTDNLTTPFSPALKVNNELTSQIEAFNRIKRLRDQRTARNHAQQHIKKHMQDAANSDFGGIRPRQSDSQFPSQYQNFFISEQDSRMSDLR